MRSLFSLCLAFSSLPFFFFAGPSRAQAPRAPASSGETGKEKPSPQARVIRRLIQAWEKESGKKEPDEKILDEIRVYGEKAVPFLLEACSVPSPDWGLVKVLFAVDGPKVKEWLEKRWKGAGPEEKAAFLAFLRKHALLFSASEKLFPYFFSFLEDPDPGIRSRACRAFFWILSSKKALALAGDPDPLVRLTFWRRFRELVPLNRWSPPLPPFTGDPRVLAALFHQGLSSPQKNIRLQAFLALWEDMGDPDHPPYILPRILTLPQGKAAVVSTFDPRTIPMNWWGKVTIKSCSSQYDLPQLPLDPRSALPASQLLAAARAMGPRVNEPKAWSSREKVQKFFHSLLSGSLPFWTRKDLPAAVGLAGLGYLGKYDLFYNGFKAPRQVDWIRGHLHPGDLPLVLQAPPLLRDPDILGWAAMQVSSHPDYLPLLKKTLEETKRVELAELISLVPGPKAAANLKDLLEKEPQVYYYPVVNFLLDRLRWGPRPPGSSLLAVLSAASRFISDTSLRPPFELVRRVLEMETPGAEKVLGRLLERLCKTLKFREPGDFRAFFPEQCTPLVKKILAREYLARFPALREFLERSPSRRKDFETAFSFLAGAGPPEAKKALLPFLRDRDESVRASALSFLARMTQFNDPAPFRSLLRDPSSHVREALAKALGNSLPASKKDLLLLSRDQDPGVALAALRNVRPALTPRDVPFLLDLCRSPHKKVAQAAKEALEDLRFIEEQRSFWKNRKEGGNKPLSPLEALLRQASSSNPRKIRLLAVRSLAALGDPKALPFLIELVRDKDPAVAASAEKSLQRILDQSGAPPPPGK